MKTKNVKVSEISIKKELYPRMNPDWVTKSRYYNAMKAGAKFPAITVAKLNNVLVLVDGYHRLQAHKDLGNSTIEAEVLEGLDEKQIFVESVKRNIIHGKQFTTQEVTKVILTLEEFELTPLEISDIIRLPVNDIKPFVAKRMTTIVGSQKPFALKKPLVHLSNIELEKEPQSIHGGHVQVAYVDTLISLIKNGWIENTNEHLMSRLEKLYELIKPYFNK